MNYQPLVRLMSRGTAGSKEWVAKVQALQNSFWLLVEREPEPETKAEVTLQRILSCK